MADLFGGAPITRQDKLGEVRREIAMRRRVYGRQVTMSRMTQDAADRGIAIMEAIAADYEGAPRLHGALAGLLAEFRKFSRYGSPIAHAANEAIQEAESALAEAGS